MALEFITDKALAPFSHGFFTRKGGASSGIFDGLNCAYTSSDQYEAVSVNRARVAGIIGVAAGDLRGVKQIHSAKVFTVEAPKGTVDPEAPRIEADAMVTNLPGIALSVLTADCQPVLFADAEARVIGAAHAGWKGARDDILENTVSAMEALGAKRDRIHAVIGPSISQRAYEVGPEFAEDFIDLDRDFSKFFANGKADRFQFDMPSFGLSKLRAAGIASAQWTGQCTYSDPERFYSYRRATHENAPDYGRMISVIAL